MFDFIKMSFVHAFEDVTKTPFLEIALVIYILGSLVVTTIVILYLIYDAYVYHRNIVEHMGHVTPFSDKIGTTGYNFDEPGCYFFILATLPFFNLVGYPFIIMMSRIKK
jgi:hypothetical protein